MYILQVYDLFDGWVWAGENDEITYLREIAFHYPDGWRIIQIIEESS